MTKPILTQAELKSFLHYSPISGEFTWLTNTSHRVKVGRIAGTSHTAGYVAITLNRKQYLAHRLAHLYMNGCMPIYEIDHVNSVRNDNRWANLRNATHAENIRNTRMFAHNTSGARGVYLRKDTGKWQAQIKVHGKNMALGSFKTIEQASNARNAKAKEIHGDFYRATGEETFALIKVQSNVF